MVRRGQGLTATSLMTATLVGGKVKGRRAKRIAMKTQVRTQMHQTMILMKAGTQKRRTIGSSYRRMRSRGISRCRGRRGGCCLPQLITGFVVYQSVLFCDRRRVLRDVSSAG